MVDASHEKEARAKETISQLKSEISNLSRLVEQGAGLSMGQENQVNELIKDKDDLTAERDAQVQQIADLRQEINDYLSAARAKEQERLAAGQEIQSLKEIISTRRAEADRELRRRERLEKEAKDLKHLIANRDTILKTRNSQLATSDTNVARVEEQLERQRKITDKAARELEMTKQRVAEKEAALAQQQAMNQEQLAANAGKQNELKRKDDEITAARQDAAKQAKLKDAQMKKTKVFEDENVELKKVQESLRGQAAQLEREIDFEKKEQLGDRKAATDVKKELEELDRMLDKTQAPAPPPKARTHRSTHPSSPTSFTLSSPTGPPSDPLL